MDLTPKNECPTCSKTFKIKKYLNRHVVTHDPDAKIKCKMCGKILKNLTTLSLHRRMLHSNRERPKCDVCHRTFFDPPTLRRHQDAMHKSGERSRLPCTFPACEKTYLVKSDLSRHLKRDHSENPGKFSCILCGKQFKFRTNLQLHISTHTTEKPFQCATCGRSFARMQDLKRHEMTHLEKSTQARFKCKICTMTFLTSLNLQRHSSAVHENQRNFCCIFCSKRFSISHNLHRHVVSMHPVNKEKIYSCDQCEYKSHSTWNLAVHRKRHDAKKRECYFCGKKFANFSDLRRHCGRIHTLEK